MRRGGLRAALALRVLLAACGILGALVAGVLIARSQDPSALPGLMIAVGIGGLGAAAALVLLWRGLDAEIGQGVDALAAQLRARVHARAPAPLDTGAAAGLGDLGPAAEALCTALETARSDPGGEAAEVAKRLEAERRELVEILSEIPVGVLVADADDRVLLYDRQSVHALAGVASLALGRSVFDYFAAAPLRQALRTLSTDPDRHFLDAELPLAEGGGTVGARIRLREAGRGYALMMEVEEGLLAERPLAFDFAPVLAASRGDLAETPLSELAYVIFDTETTGLDPSRDALVQIGAVRGMRGRCVAGESFHTLVDPGRPIPPGSSRIHGITDADVAGAPGPVAALAAFHRFARDAVLVAHNAPFDLAFLRRGAAGSRLEFDHPVLDTVLLSAAVYGEEAEHTLDAIARRLSVPISAAERHTAQGDARATAAVFFRLLDILAARGVTTFGAAVAAMRRHERLFPDPNRAREDS